MATSFCSDEKAPKSVLKLNKLNINVVFSHLKVVVEEGRRGVEGEETNALES